MNDITLQHIRHEIYTCFERAGDALFNLVDALVSECQAQSLPELSSSPFFERKWSSVYEALEDGRINVEQLRAVLVKALLAASGDNELVRIALDATNMEKPDAKTSEDRGVIHVSNLPLVDKPLSVGWRVTSRVLLPASPSSWAPTLDQRRISTQETPIEVAIAQLQALKPLFGNRKVIVMADRGYCTPTFLRACRELGYRVLVRLKSDRKLYRPGGRIHPRGPMPKDGAQILGKRKETHTEPEAVCQTQDSKGKSVQISRWGDLHFQQDRGLQIKVLGVERERAKGTKRDPRVSWFVTFDDSIALSEIPQEYALRFCQEHNYRFSKQHLLWTDVHVRTPEQFERWSWLVAIAFDLLYLARDLAQVTLRPWESKDRPVTPQQVRRAMPAILLRLGTPAKPCQPRGKSPGRALGFQPKPAKRFAVVVKHPKERKKPKEPLKPTG